MTIGLSKSESKFHNYKNWLEHFNINYIVLDYENHDEDLKKFDNCSGLIFIGWS